MKLLLPEPGDLINGKKIECIREGRMYYNVVNGAFDYAIKFIPRIIDKTYHSFQKRK